MLFSIWLRNRRTDRGIPEARDGVVPRAARLAARGVAAVVLAAAAVAFLSPQTAIDLWPWQLSALTARVLAGFTAQVGIAALVLARDRRWSAWRLIVQAFFVATAFLLIGALRARDDFDDGNPLTWLYLAGLLGSAAALGALYQRMERSIAATASGT
jgi:peptidoglycan/LPS O-acetylase OafA/YrhL